MDSREKLRPHYDLKEIQAQMQTVKAMRLTGSATTGILDLEMEPTDALAVVASLAVKDHFYKSMPTRRNHKVWQDVYHATWGNKELYIKFQLDEKGYFVISFKDQEDGY